MKKTKLALVIALSALIIAGGIIMCMKLFKKSSPYGKDGKLREGVTLEQIKSVKQEHGELISASFYRGGGMNGDSYSVMLKKTEDGTKLTIRETPEHWIPQICSEYSMPDDALKEIREFIDKYNLPVWNDLPYSEFQVLDAPSSSISFAFDDRALGGSRYQSYGVSYDQIEPKGGEGVLKEFVRLLEKHICEANRMDLWYESGDEQIRIGAGVENTDEQINMVLSGYWDAVNAFRLSASGERTPVREFSRDDGLTLYNDLYSERYTVRRYKKGDETTTHPLLEPNIVHEQTAGVDCSWHIVLQKDAEQPLDIAVLLGLEPTGAPELLLTLEDARLYLMEPGADGEYLVIELYRLS